MKFPFAINTVRNRQPSAVLRQTYAGRFLHIHWVGTDNVSINTQVHDGVVILTTHQHRVTRPYTGTTRFLYVLISDCSRCAIHGVVHVHNVSVPVSQY
ncbi:hypothetical protein DPMN_131753 [Dreissena polymorpha]|uniref:Uncharacterized protein n=1 Tax=Dreissena polymorpha TaxID=45954 RepID=A0A9D4FX14_DREPO|nr:hypothetical protein DPMN_131753 [Dreissena polymorpha]